jgi:hypothetical protein
MTTFKINENLEVVCNWKKTRNGFKHEATLLKNGRETESVKICYLNRTWESYEYQSVLEKLLSQANLSEEEKNEFSEKIKGNEWREKDLAGLKMIAGIAKLGEILCQGKKESNDWKKRMLTAGLEGKGLIMPDDWDELSEETKEARLNGAIKTLQE